MDGVELLAGETGEDGCCGVEVVEDL